MRPTSWIPILALCFLCPRAITPALAAETTPEKPNIIYVMADDLGYGDLGCYGQKHVATPNIDRLAAGGMRFTNAYSGASVCAPARSVLMTGLHTGHTRVRGNAGIVGGVGNQRRVPLKAEDFTVAELLKRAGYATGITGKWGLGEPKTTGVPNRQGFDEWFGYLNQRHAHSYYPEFLWHNQRAVPLPDNYGHRQGVYSHDLVTEFALDFVRTQAKKPFFLYLAWTIPHGNYEIPDATAYSDRPWPEEDRIYAAMVDLMDRDFGRLMAALEELDIDRKTVVFFCSDNGSARRRDGVLDSVGPFRSQKGSPYEGGLRVPMIARWAGQIEAGAVSDLPWYFADFMPTAADLAGIDAPNGIDGVSIVPTLLGRPQDLSNRMMYWEQIGRNRLTQSVRWGDWKAVRLEQNAPLELYDLARDPGEEHDVAAEHPDVVKRIETYLTTARTESPNWPTPAASPDN